MYRILLLFVCFPILGLAQNIEGCMDPTALNYNTDLTSDDGPCEGSIESLFNKPILAIK